MNGGEPQQAVVNAAAENQEAYREPACRGKPNQIPYRYDGCPIQDPMTTASLLGFCDPGHFRGEGDFYNFSSPRWLRRDGVRVR